MENNYYLYRWIRLDKNIPFYIGIGTKTKDDLKYGIYTRARVFKKKNTIWEHIVSKTEYRVDIMLESNDYKFIKQKEIEFIKLYGRINLGTGCLSNMTDGGEGTKNVVTSDYTRKLKSMNATGIKRSKESIEKRLATLIRNNFKPSKETIRKIALTKSKAVLQFSLEGKLIKDWDKLLIASETLNIPKYVITIAANIKNMTSFTGQNYIWVYKEDYEKGFLDKFNIALERVKQGQIKTCYSEEIRLNILEDFYLFDYHIRKGEKVKELSKKYEINYSTIRAIIRNYELDNKILPKDNRYNRDKEIYNEFMNSTQKLAGNKAVEISNRFHMSESSIRGIVRKFK